MGMKTEHTSWNRSPAGSNLLTLTMQYGHAQGWPNALLKLLFSVPSVTLPDGFSADFQPLLQCLFPWTPQTKGTRPLWTSCFGKNRFTPGKLQYYFIRNIPKHLYPYVVSFTDTWPEVSTVRKKIGPQKDFIPSNIRHQLPHSLTYNGYLKDVTQSDAYICMGRDNHIKSMPLLS